MKNAVVMSLILFTGTISAAHTEHMKAPDIQLVEGNVQDKPEMMGATSVKLLETQIDITGDHGQGRFFSEEKTEVQKYINQGFAMLNVFQYTDAFRSFQTAVSLNPASVEAQIGRGFAAASSSFAGEGQSYYIGIARSFLLKNKDVLTHEQKAWANLLLAMVTGADLEDNLLDMKSAYVKLKIEDADNLEVSLFANWVSQTYDTSAFDEALKKDPTNAGATHYLLHLGEMRGDHNTAVFHGEKLAKFALGSGHGQHMYGHALPHFNKWNEADRQFTIAHDLHVAWAEKNNVHPSEDWHYSHNLDLWSVTNMVLNPSRAVLVLEELEQFSVNYTLDLLDLKVVTAVDLEKVDSDISVYENRRPEWKDFVRSSRKLHTLVSQPENFDTLKAGIVNDLDFQGNAKDNTLYVAVVLIEAVKAGDIATTAVVKATADILKAKATEDLEAKAKAETAKTKAEAEVKVAVQREKQAVNYITKSLSQAFSSGGFDGWRKSVLETLIYTRIFEVYGLDRAANELRLKVSDVYMNPVD